MRYWIESATGDLDEILADAPVTIGRTAGVTIRLTDQRVSRVHCMVYRTDGGVTVADLGSRNGTAIDGTAVDSQRIWRPGEVLTLGPDVAEFRLRVEDAESEPMAFPAAADPRWVAVAFSLAIIWLLVSQAVFFGQLFRVERPEPLSTGSDVEPVATAVVAEISWLRDELGEDDVPMDPGFVAAVEAQIGRYQHLPDFRRAMERRTEYRHHVEEVFDSYNVPRILTLIPIVESYFYSRAWNRRTDARGMWQFRPLTAREYGLVIAANRDDRLDPVASSTAAARYLQDLLAVFGYESVALVAAAYNAGDGRIRYALRQVSNPETDRSFWHLSQQKLLPVETRGYVIKLFAAAILAHRFDEPQLESR